MEKDKYIVLFDGEYSDYFETFDKAYNYAIINNYGERFEIAKIINYKIIENK